MKIKAVLFDFDGVLADTMEDLFLAWKKAFQHYYNIRIRREDYFPLEGTKLKKIAENISEKYNLNNPNLENIVELKNKYYLENHKFSFYTGVVELIDFLKGKKSMAIVSASPKEKLEKTIPKNFLNKFDVIVFGDDTTKGKPDPQPYLKAIEKLNLNPEDCVVVENAPLGIKSAKSAGAYCIAITTTLSEKYLQEADKIINNHKELKTVLEVNNP